MERFCWEIMMNVIMTGFSFGGFCGLLFLVWRRLLEGQRF